MKTASETPLPAPWAIVCPKCGAQPLVKCVAVDDADWEGVGHWRLMPRTARTEEAHLHVERFVR